MDKYEFNLKMEQLKKLFREEDYHTALKIVNGIDWERVRNTNLLTMAATVYEKNDNLDEAKMILERAYKRAPVGKRILFKLCELSVRTGDLKQAEDYYYEFRQADPQDTNIYLLQYMILKARHAPYEKQLEPLQLFCREEMNDRWLYELACTYDYAGKTSDCVKTCDQIALMYGNGRYSQKALRLKMRYAPLTDEQKAILYPNSASSESWYRDETDDDRIASDRFNSSSVSETDTLAGTRYEEYGIVAEPNPSEAGVIKEDPVEEYEDTLRKQAEAKKNSDALALARYENEDEAFEAYLSACGLKENDQNPVNDTQTPATDQAETVTAENGQTTEDASSKTEADDEVSDEGQQMEFDFGEGTPKVVEATPEQAETKVEISEETNPAIETEKPLSVPDSAIGDDPARLKADVIAQNTANIPLNIAAGASVATLAVSALDTAVKEADAAIKPAGQDLPAINKATETLKEKDEGVQTPKSAPKPAPMTIDRVKEGTGHHFIVEAQDAKSGLIIAVNELKRLHSEFNLDHGSVKTSAAKLNGIGLSTSVINKIRDKDFVIEDAGDLDDDLLEEICDFIRTDESGTIVVLVDTPDGMDHIEDTVPELFEACGYVSDIENEDEDEDHDGYEDDYEDEDAADQAYDDRDTQDRGYDEEEDYDTDDQDDKSDSDPKSTASESKKRSNGETKKRFSNLKAIPARPGEEMDSDAFAQYCMQYAQGIDCSINGTSMLALYERIELMEEDGIALTKENAEQLIEETADRAEKPPIGKRLKGMFHSKYDKNGCLILKESDFIY